MATGYGFFSAFVCLKFILPSSLKVSFAGYGLFSFVFSFRTYKCYFTLFWFEWFSMRNLLMFVSYSYYTSVFFSLVNLKIVYHWLKENWLQHTSVSFLQVSCARVLLGFGISLNSSTSDIFRLLLQILFPFPTFRISNYTHTRLCEVILPPTHVFSLFLYVFMFG